MYEALLYLHYLRKIESQRDLARKSVSNRVVSNLVNDEVSLNENEEKVEFQEKSNNSIFFLKAIIDLAVTPIKIKELAKEQITEFAINDLEIKYFPKYAQIFLDPKTEMLEFVDQDHFPILKFDERYIDIELNSSYEDSDMEDFDETD